MTELRFELSANLSLLFTEVPLLDRFAAASSAGFRSVELWWPFADAQPPRSAVDDLVDAIQASGCRLSGLNFFAGDMRAGERGILSDPGRRPEFQDNVAVVTDIADRTGCRMFNALYGTRRPGLGAVQHAETALENIALACSAVDGFGGTVLLEPLSGVEGYQIRTVADAVQIIQAAHDLDVHGKLALLFDTFHLATNGEDLIAAIKGSGELIGHVQVADAPGRGHPGTGRIDFGAVLSALAAHGYDGLVACEYAPTGRTAESLDWTTTMPLVQLAGHKSDAIDIGFRIG